MNYTVAILTKSSKNGGYCVAGIDIKNGNWVRLVSNDEDTHGALSEDDILYQDGSTCTPLDIVEIPIIELSPSKYQPENVLIDTEYYWNKLDIISLKNLLEIHPPEHHNVLLGNPYPYITEAKIENVGHSLILVKVTDLIITQKEVDKKVKAKATFMYDNTQYENISITDPDYYSAPNHYTIATAILVMSLPGHPYNKKYYKFIAKIFPISNHI